MLGWTCGIVTVSVVLSAVFAGMCGERTSSYKGSFLSFSVCLALLLWTKIRTIMTSSSSSTVTTHTSGGSRGGSQGAMEPPFQSRLCTDTVARLQLASSN